jgi:peptidoglycan biosynthesis protein MviN/MurJ (putative lipid II flippase)
MGRLRVGGLALALSLSQVVNFGALFAWLEKKIGPMDRRAVAATAGKALAASALMAAALLFFRPVIDVATAPFARQAAGLAAAIALGIGLYILSLWLISPKEAKSLVGTVLHAARPRARKEAG